MTVSTLLFPFAVKIKTVEIREQINMFAETSGDALERAFSIFFDGEEIPKAFFISVHPMRRAVV
jgi:hypothetical protein